MSGSDGAPWWEPLPLTCEPIKVQGITVRPGDNISVNATGGPRLMRFKGWAVVPAFTYRDNAETAGYWMEGEPGMRPGEWPGPYRIESLSHPSLLDGIIREIDAD